MTVRRGLTGIALCVALAGAALAGPAQTANAAGGRTGEHEHTNGFRVSQHDRHGDRHGHRHRGRNDRRHGVGIFSQENLVSDQPGVAALTDPNLVNPWGLSHGPTTPVWASDNGTNVSTLYTGDVGPTPVSKVPLTVNIPDGAPTGQVFNDTPDFMVPGTGLPASFLFTGEAGKVWAWNSAAGTTAVQVASTDGAVYKGMALVNGIAGP